MNESIEDGPRVEAPAHPDPAARAFRDAAGIPLEAGGGTWLLPRLPYARGLDVQRDAIFNDVVYSRSAQVGECLKVAWSLLRANYDLTGEEAASLAMEADPAALCGAVFDALVPAADPGRGVSDWVRSSLLANGLDPAAIPADDLPHVLHQLERTGRIVPLAEFADICKIAAKRRKLLDQAGLNGPTC